MDLRSVLNDLKSGLISVDEAEKKLKTAPFEDLGFAVIDHQRALRTGCPEVIYCAGKTDSQIESIILKMLESAALLCRLFPVYGFILPLCRKNYRFNSGRNATIDRNAIIRRLIIRRTSGWRGIFHRCPAIGLL